MKFLNPWGFLYGGVIIVIILLYMLKPRHTQLVVSSTYLWDKTLKDMEASRPWQKLKNNILMILQILIAILLVLAIARPYIAATSIHSDMVVLLDCSASMQADDVAPTRFEKAKGEVLKLVDGMMPQQSTELRFRRTSTAYLQVYMYLSAHDLRSCCRSRTVTIFVRQLERSTFRRAD